MENRNTDERTVAPHSKLNYSCRHRSGMLAALLVAVIMVALTMGGQPALATTDPEYLYITGIVKSVNAATGLVTVDVMSSSCKGMRIFKANKLDKLESYMEQKVSFFIDSERCQIKEVHAILVERGLWK